MNYYLQAESEEALFAALESAGVMNKVYDPEDPANQRPDDAEEWEPSGEYDLFPKAGVDLDVIGTIWKPTGVMLTDEEGNQYPQMEPLDGFHANIRGITEEQAALLPTIAKPSSPVRIWAGD
jgi:hypothetical protein